MIHHPVRRSRRSVRGLLQALLAVATAALLVALSLSQSTEERPAKRTLARSIAILAEVDSFLDDNLDALRREAEGSDDGVVELADFPVSITLSSDELQNEDREMVRSLLIARAAGRVYEEGSSAFREQPQADRALLSKERALEEGMDAFRAGPHDVLFVAAAVAAGVTVLLALVVLLTSPLDRGLIRVGASIAIGTVPVLLVAIIARLALGIAAGSTGDYLTREFFGIGEDLTWAPIRNGLVFLGAGAAIAVLGLTLTPRGGRMTADRGLTLA